jgi:hypothetical protein
MKYRQLTLIEEPSPFDTLDVWKAFLAQAQALPDDDAKKDVAVAIAEDCIRMKLKEASRRVH